VPTRVDAIKLQNMRDTCKTVHSAKMAFGLRTRHAPSSSGSSNTTVAQCVVDGPALPEQGGVMPILWQPSFQTDLNLNLAASSSTTAVYTLNLVTTQTIQRGILLRFQMWDGIARTYDNARADGALCEWDLVIRRDIPPATKLVVKMDTAGTAIYGFTGHKTYATGGAGIPLPYFTEGSSLLCLAFQPSSPAPWRPARGQPMFAIGFYVPADDHLPECCTSVSTTGLSVTAPNFPDQWSGGTLTWTFLYQVAFPFLVTNPLYAPDFTGVDCCIHCPGIKVAGNKPLYARGSWSNLREEIAQPWTLRKTNYYAPTAWTPYFTDTVSTSPLLNMTPDSGPFLLAAAPGQLAVVYFRPRYADIHGDDDTPVVSSGQLLVYRDSGSAEVGFVVTSPLYPGQALYFTHTPYNSDTGGFGPRTTTDATALYVVGDPSFVWTVGSKVIPAGTVIVVTNIGAVSGAIAIQNAHDAGDDVGVISLTMVNGGDTGTTIPSLIITSAWVQNGIAAPRPWTAHMFVTAALSEQYSGDFPPLSPGLTMHHGFLTGTSVYGRGKVLDNTKLPGTVQSALVNSGPMAPVNSGDLVAITELPSFRGMQHYRW
jgi:hypothetical protein